MLLDFPKLERTVNRRFPPEPGSEPLILRMEHSLVSYVKGQSLVSLIIGTSAGSGYGSSASSAGFRTGRSTRCSSVPGLRSRS
jgi:hypothetical protein